MVLVKLVSDLSSNDIREAVATDYGRDVKRLLNDLDRLAVRWGSEIMYGPLAFKEGPQTLAQIQLKLIELREALKT